MILFFDRNVGVAIPTALKLLNLPVQIEAHQDHFPIDEPDDVWLPLVGGWGWIVIAQDYKFHVIQAELEALKQHNIGCFYLWGAEATKWEAMRAFARGYDNIIREASRAIRPFAFKVEKHGGVNEIVIP